MTAALSSALDDLDDDPATRVIVLTSSSQAQRRNRSRHRLGPAHRPRGALRHHPPGHAACP